MASKNQTLGQVIKQARELRRLSLREVEIQAGISNAYLSQLENDKIKKPSANTLYKISELFNINFDELLFLAGIVEKKKDYSKPSAHFAFSSNNLTQFEEQKLIEYLNFLRFQNKNDQ